MKTFAFAFIVTTAILCGPGQAQAQAPGRIVVNHDEWTLTPTGFSQAPDTQRYVQNLTRWFIGNGQGSFLGYSTNPGILNASLSNAITSLGHQWTANPNITFDLATLQQFDGVFLCNGAGVNFDTAVAIAYVQGGGNIYLASGSGGGDATFDAFLQNFGLDTAPAFNGITGALPVDGGHPLFFGVSSLYFNNGRDVVDLSASDCESHVIGTVSGNDAFSAYQPREQLTINIDPIAATAGDTVTLDVRNGPTGVPLILAIVDVTGLPWFQVVAFTNFDANCACVMSTTVPPALAGEWFGVQAFAMKSPSGVIMSNVATLAIQ